VSKSEVSATLPREYAAVPVSSWPIVH